MTDDLMLTLKLNTSTSDMAVHLQPEFEDYTQLMLELHAMIITGRLSDSAIIAAKHLIHCWKIGVVTIGSVAI